MAINLPNLSSSLTLNTAQFQAALATARAALSNMGTTAKNELGGMATALTKLAVGLPAIAAVTTALGGIVAGAAAAGLAAGAFGAAIAPQMKEVTAAGEAATAAEKAQELATRKKAEAQALASTGGKAYKAALDEAKSATEAASEADAAYQRQLAGMPPASRETATALKGLKDDYSKWSDSLAGSTMPVATKGIQFMRDLLPTLTPFVKAASTAFSGMFDKLSAGIKGAGFKSWATDMSSAAGPALTNFITVIGNLGRGFGGLLQAFAPAAQGTTGGLVAMTDAFADWAQGLKGSEGFERFLESARNGAGMLGNLGSALLNLAIALSPLFGATALLADGFARLIIALPTPVLTAIAAVLTTIGVAMKLWAISTAIAATATATWSAIQAVFNVIMAANPIVLVTLAIIALAAAIVIAYKKSETFREIVQGVWAVTRAAIWTAVESIKSTINWFGALPDKLGGWFGQAKDSAINKLAQLVSWTGGLPGRLGGALSNLGPSLAVKGREGIQSMKDAASAKAGELVSWVRGIPGQVTGALGDLGGLLWNAGTRILQGLIDGVSSKISDLRGMLSNVTGLIPDWKGPEDVDKKLLTPAGASIMDGLMRGIDARLPDLRSQLAGITASISPMVTASIPTSAAITGAYTGSSAPARTIAPTINLYGSDASVGSISRELAWAGLVG